VITVEWNVRLVLYLDEEARVVQRVAVVLEDDRAIDASVTLNEDDSPERDRMKRAVDTAFDSPWPNIEVVRTPSA
jgi:hypothetical protein